MEREKIEFHDPSPTPPHQPTKAPTVVYHLPTATPGHQEKSPTPDVTEISTHIPNSTSTPNGETGTPEINPTETKTVSNPPSKNNPQPISTPSSTETVAAEPIINITPISTIQVEVTATPTPPETYIPSELPKTGGLPLEAVPFALAGIAIG